MALPSFYLMAWWSHSSNGSRTATSTKSPDDPQLHVVARLRQHLLPGTMLQQLAWPLCTTFDGISTGSRLVCFGDEFLHQHANAISVHILSPRSTQGAKQSSHQGQSCLRVVANIVATPGTARTSSMQLQPNRACPVYGKAATGGAHFTLTARREHSRMWRLRATAKFCRNHGVGPGEQQEGIPDLSPGGLSLIANTDSWLSARKGPPRTGDSLSLFKASDPPRWLLCWAILVLCRRRSDASASMGRGFARWSCFGKTTGPDGAAHRVGHSAATAAGNMWDQR